MTDVFNPLDPALTIDPYPHYEALRARDPVHYSPMGFWLLTRHDDVATALASPALEHQYVLTQKMRSGELVVDEPYFAIFRQMVFVLDNPDHRRVRKLSAGWFTPRRIAAGSSTTAATPTPMTGSTANTR